MLWFPAKGFRALDDGKLLGNQLFNMDAQRRGQGINPGGHGKGIRPPEEQVVRGLSSCPRC